MARKKNTSTRIKRFSDLYNLNPSMIMVYGAVWCTDCKRAKQFFGD